MSIGTSRWALPCAPAILLLACDPDKGDDFNGYVELERFSGTTTCTADSPDRVSLNGLKIVSYKTIGYTDGGDSSSRPTDPEGDAPSPGNPVKAVRADSPCNGATSWRPTNGSDGDWYSLGGDNTFRDCGGLSCGATDPDSCSGTYGVTIDPDTSEGESCSMYNPVKVYLDTLESGAKRRTNPAHDCTAGSGRFRLLSRHSADLDSDGDIRVSMIPIQRSGTGVMTNAAWITEIDIVEDKGNTLKVVKPNQDIGWDETDHLDDPGIAITLQSTNDFDQGVVSGNPVFVAEEIDPDDAGQMEVDITWTCGTAPSVTQPRGYAFSLNDIGCAPVQMLVMRPRGTPPVISWEQYGNPTYSRVTPTTTVQGGYAFRFEQSLLVVEGVLESYDETDAEVDITSIQWDGEDICDAGQYVFDAE